jgi:hypothetical protein
LSEEEAEPTVDSVKTFPDAAAVAMEESAKLYRMEFEVASTISCRRSSITVEKSVRVTVLLAALKE